MLPPHYHHWECDRSDVVYNSPLLGLDAENSKGKWWDVLLRELFWIGESNNKNNLKTTTLHQQHNSSNITTTTTKRPLDLKRVVSIRLCWLTPARWEWKKRERGWGGGGEGKGKGKMKGKGKEKGKVKGKGKGKGQKEGQREGQRGGQFDSLKSNQKLYTYTHTVCLVVPPLPPTPLPPPPSLPPPLILTLPGRKGANWDRDLIEFFLWHFFTANNRGGNKSANVWARCRHGFWYRE
jgi:hypothetical protein